MNRDATTSSGSGRAENRTYRSFLRGILLATAILALLQALLWALGI